MFLSTRKRGALVALKALKHAVPTPDRLAECLETPPDLGAAGTDQRTCGQFDFGPFIGRSEVMMQMYARIRRVATVDSTVLILGETGTGKELVAQALHQMSPRSAAPFLAVNIAAVPTSLADSELFGHVRGAFTGAVDHRTGRLEQANGGTLLLDEIADLDPAVQSKLLRVLDTRIFTPVGGATDHKCNVRIMTSTSRDIREMVRARKFREDLFYRLDVVTISVPPLRDRPDDIPLLVAHFLHTAGEERRADVRTVSPQLMERLVADPWPGNVRELRNTLESMRVMARGESLDVEDLNDRLAVTRHQVVSRHRNQTQ